MSSDCRKIFFNSDDIKLQGYIHIPDTDTPSFVICSHGLLSDAFSKKQINLADRLIEQNIGCIRFHHRGCGESEGVLENTDLLSRKKDIISAFEYLKKNFKLKKTGLFGSSMGGAASIYSYSDINPDAIAVAAAPVFGDTMKSYSNNSLDNMMKETGLSKEFFEKNTNFNLVDQIHIIKNILIFHGEDDEIVPFENASVLFKRSGEDKKLIKFEQGDHRISDPEYQDIMINEAVKWFGFYL